MKTLAAPFLIVTAFGLAWAHALGLTAFVNPTFIDWMIEGDWLGHLFGWLFTRNGPWMLPLAQAPDLVYPAGSSAALTDAIPLLSVIGKLLAPLWSVPVQFFGLWMVLGVIGTGLAGVLVCRGWFKDTASLALAGCLFVMNPIVSTRYGHPPFFAFWMLTGLVGAAVWPVGDLKSARRTAAVTLALGFLACATNAYLAVMASIVVGASIARLALVHRSFERREAIAWLVAGPVVCAFSLWAFGFVSGARSSPMGNLAIEGFGQFSADMLTFVNPTMWSRYLPGLGMGPRQYEGFAYLGLGVLVLLVARLVLLIKYRPTRAEWLSLLPLFLACAGCAFYSLSNVATIGGKQVFELRDFYAHFGPWPSVFRSSGRFVWPLFAWLTLIAAVSFARVKQVGVRQVALALAVMVQVTDFDPTRTPLNKEYPKFQPFRDPAWAMLKDYPHLMIHPIQIQWTCPFDHHLVAKLSWEAVRQHLTINSGHVGRPPPGTDCNAHLGPADLRDDTVYIPYFKPFLPDFISAGFVCAPVEGYAVCVSPGRQTPLLQELLRRQRPE
ncbi:MAG: DUF6311 domain-containing protein [Myxococcaceae bacterium]